MSKVTLVQYLKLILEKSRTLEIHILSNPDGTTPWRYKFRSLRIGEVVEIETINKDVHTLVPGLEVIDLDFKPRRKLSSPPLLEINVLNPNR